MRASRLFGPFLIGVAAALWSTDALFRFPTVIRLDPMLLVLFEHALGLTFLLPWIFIQHPRHTIKLNLAQGMAAAFIGIGGSAVATVLFTASFRYINPSVTILLQKLQPIIVVLIAYLFLGEKPKIKFLVWAGVALMAAIVLGFPDLDFRFLAHGFDPRSRGVFYALTSSVLWAAATIAGKILLRRVPSALATFWRYLFGFGALLILVVVSRAYIPWDVLTSKPVFLSLAYMSLVPGLAAMLAYYAGLARTPANVTTFVELIFPICAVILNWIVLQAPLAPIQIAAGLVLLFSVTKISSHT